jgi:hypothetical protein
MLDIFSICPDCGQLEPDCECVWQCQLCLLLCLPGKQCPCQEHDLSEGMRCERVTLPPPSTSLSSD